MTANFAAYNLHFGFPTPFLFGKCLPVISFCLFDNPRTCVPWSFLELLGVLSQLIYAKTFVCQPAADTIVDNDDAPLCLRINVLLISNRRAQVSAPPSTRRDSLNSSKEGLSCGCPLFAYTIEASLLVAGNVQCKEWSWSLFFGHVPNNAASITRQLTACLAENVFVRQV